MSRNRKHRLWEANLELGARPRRDGAPPPAGESQRGMTAVFPRGRQILAARRYSLTLQ